MADGITQTDDVIQETVTIRTPTLSIDGRGWPVPCDITRTAEMTPSAISGVLLDGTYFNDVLGTYLSYDVVMAVPPTMDAEYEALYEVLTAPVESHLFTLPYGRRTVDINARVESVRDVLVYTKSGKQYWRGVTFRAVSNHPTKQQVATDAIERGIAPLPQHLQVPYGTTFTATEHGWDEHVFDDADAKRY